MPASRPQRGARLLALGVAAAAGVATLAPASARAADPWQPPSYVRTIGHPGHAGVYAWGAATAIDGSILIGDYWNYTIRRYSPAGKLLGQFGSKGQGPGQLMGPHGVASDPKDGSVYVSDQNAPWQIEKYDRDGRYVRTISMYVPGVTVPYPYMTHLTVGLDGLLYTVSSHNVPPTFANRVVAFNPDGTYHHSFGTNGTVPGTLGLVHGIDTGPGGEVYLGDTTQHLVQVYSSTGTFLRSFGKGYFTGDMRGVRVDRVRGWVYVADTESSQIEKFDLAGRHLATFGSEGTGPGQFRDGAREFAVDADGNLHAPDFGNFRVNVYSSAGVYLRSYPSPAPAPAPDGFNQAQDVVVTPDGSAVYTADTYNHRIQQFTPEGALVRTWGFRGSTAPDAMNYPRGLALDPGTGDVVLLNTREGNVKRYSATGAFRGSFGSWGTGPGQFNLPRGIAVTAQGRVVIGDSINRRLQILTATGEPVTAVPCGAPAPIGKGPQLLGGCVGVTTDPSGAIYAAAVSEHVVYKFAPDGALLAKFGTQGNGPGQFQAPYDVAVHDGRLYVTDGNLARVSVLTLDGAYVGRFGVRGAEEGKLLSPRGIAISDAGTVYVMDGVAERVTVFRLPS